MSPSIPEPTTRFAPALAHLNGDPDLLARAAQAALTAFQETREQLLTLETSKALPEIGIVAHKLVYGWALFAQPDQAELARQLEQAALAGNETGAMQLRQHFIEQLASVSEELGHFLNGTHTEAQ